MKHSIFDQVPSESIIKPPSFVQPYRLRRIRGKSFRPGWHYTRPYSFAELKEWSSPFHCRVYTICPNCWNGELVETHQLETICREHSHRKVAVEFGCRHCERFGTFLIETSLLADLANLNHARMTWRPHEHDRGTSSADHHSPNAAPSPATIGG